MIPKNTMEGFKHVMGVLEAQLHTNKRFETQFDLVFDQFTQITDILTLITDEQERLSNRVARLERLEGLV